MPLRIKGYTAYVCCDGEKLEQYDVKQEDEGTIACWIASEEGKEFTIHWEDESSATVMQVIIKVDDRVMLRRAHQRCPNDCFSGVEDTPGHLRPVRFSPLVLTDDENAASSAAISANLGVIQVEMRQVAYYVEQGHNYCLSNVPDIGPVHEKSKKAGVHAVSFGDNERRITPSKSLAARGIQNDPFAVFKFRYRPIDLLRANGIAPPVPKPLKGKKRVSDVHTDLEAIERSDSKRRRVTDGKEEAPEIAAEVKAEQGMDEEDEDEDDRVTFLQEQIIMLQNQLTQAQTKKKSKTAIKREASPIRVPVAWTNEVIDLT